MSDHEHNSPDARDDDLDDASCLSYFSSFNRQSFETTDAPPGDITHPTSNNMTTPNAWDSAVDGPGKVPHPPMRSTITPINIALPHPSDVQQLAMRKQTRTRKNNPNGNPLAASSGGGRRSGEGGTPPGGAKPHTPTPGAANPFALTTGPIASLVAQHNHTTLAQLKATPLCSPPIPTIVLQPTVMNLTREQQVIAAQLQEQFFAIIANAGQNAQGPLAVVAPNLSALSPAAAAAAAAANAQQHGHLPPQGLSPHHQQPHQHQQQHQQQQPAFASVGTMGGGVGVMAPLQFNQNNNNGAGGPGVPLFAAFVGGGQPIHTTSARVSPGASQSPSPTTSLNPASLQPLPSLPIPNAPNAFSIPSPSNHSQHVAPFFHHQQQQQQQHQHHHQQPTAQVRSPVPAATSPTPEVLHPFVGQAYA